MKLRYTTIHQYLLTSVATIFLLLNPAKLSAQTVLDSIQETGVLRVAVREDAAPFGYLNSEKKLQGRCLNFLALLQEKLKEKLPRDVIVLSIFKSTAANRFKLVEMGIVDLECGPNTIRELPSSKVTFSQDFFITGTQLLVDKKQAKLLNLNGNLAGVTLGVVKTTTTEEAIALKYPLANIQRFSGAVARRRGVQAVRQGKIDAMVSDGILLRGEAVLENLSPNRYVLIPEIPLSCDRYAMIIKGQDNQWQDFVNSVIASEQAQQLFRFNATSTHLDRMSVCQSM
ncbi:MAG: glutamate/aspartate ABC transporter substrate-binding protein [Pleurocapsa sp.]